MKGTPSKKLVREDDPAELELVGLKCHNSPGRALRVGAHDVILTGLDEEGDRTNEEMPPLHSIPIQFHFRTKFTSKKDFQYNLYYQ